jgi:hypothetical protein
MPFRQAVSGTNVGGHKVYNPINDRLNTRRTWSTTTSYFTLGVGGEAFGQSMKEKRIGLINVTTDDIQIDMGLVIRDDEDNQIRVAFRERRGKRPVWRLVAIHRPRILEARRLD